jgi:teichuronic acid biosynthesis glycosyltransferase TuaC
MRVLTFTSLYPNRLQPRHGIFVEQRVRQLVCSGKASVRVVAPVPWVPRAWSLFGRYALLANVPASEERHGVAVLHPRYFAIPKLSGWMNPVSIALSALRWVKDLRKAGGDFDLIDAHFLYPDGAAAVLLGAWLDKPVVVTGRGTDVNVFPRYPVPGAWIRWVARRAAALITVSAALRDVLLGLGVAPDRVVVLRNGVDLELFRPLQRDLVRSELGLRGTTLLSVGHLLFDKGHHLVIEALRCLPEANLVVIGEGAQRAQLQAMAYRHGVADRVTWINTLSQTDLAKYYAAADLTVLASRNEGMPNVVLESLACGTPVIATAVGGIPEILNSAESGMLMRSRTAESIVEAYHSLMRSPPDPSSVRRHAEQFSWGSTTQGQLQLFASVLDRFQANSRLNCQSTAAPPNP